MVTLKTVDRPVGLLVLGIILFGGYSWWQATQRILGQNGMMGQMMGAMPGMNPSWYLFGTLIAVSVVLGVYVISREQLANLLSTPASTAPADRTTLTRPQALIDTHPNTLQKSPPKSRRRTGRSQNDPPH